MRSTVLEIPSRGVPGASGMDIGSAIVIVFSATSWRVVIGHSKEDQVWKFPCGKIEERDYPFSQAKEHAEDRLAVMAAECCATRELKAEAGIPLNELAFFHQLRYIRTHSVFDRVTRNKKELRQFHFVGLLDGEQPLPEHVEEEAEMDVRIYAPVGDVIKRAMQPRRTEGKFNPFHAFALTEALLFFKNLIGDDPQFENFRDLLATLRHEHIHLDTIEHELTDLIGAGRI